MLFNALQDENENLICFWIKAEKAEIPGFIVVNSFMDSIQHWHQVQREFLREIREFDQINWIVSRNNVTSNTIQLAQNAKLSLFHEIERNVHRKTMNFAQIQEICH